MANDCLELVRAFCELIGEFGCELERLVLVDLVLGDELGEKAAVHPPCDVVASRNRQKRARIVVEADGIVKTRRLGHLLAEALHTVGAVVEPPGGAKAKHRIVSSKRRELARI